MRSAGHSISRVMAALGLCDAYGVQEIAIYTSKLPQVRRPEGSKTAYLTFEGIRDARTVADKQTRLRIAMPVAQIAQLWAVLSDAR